MFCPSCGTQNPDGSKFCAGCGGALTPASAPQQEPVQPVQEQTYVPQNEPVQQTAPVSVEETAKPEKEKVDFLAAARSALKDLLGILNPIIDKVKPILLKNKLLTLGIAGAVVALLIFGVVMGVIMGSDNGFIEAEHSLVVGSDNEHIVIIYDGKLIETNIEDNGYSAQYNMDYSNCIFLTDEEELYIFNGKNVTKVADDVVHCLFSNEGEGILYMTEEGDNASLHLYDVSKKKKVEITNEADDLESAYISPDGESVLYTIDDGDEYKVMYYEGGDSIRICSGDYVGLGLSNDGDQIYVAEESYSVTLYCYDTKGNKEKLGEEVTGIAFNADLTQILFYRDGKTYISTKGKEAVKISNSRVTPLLTDNAVSFYWTDYNCYPVEDLYDRVYTGRDSSSRRCAWYIDENVDKSCKLATDVSSITYDASAEYLYYLDKNDNLMVLEISDCDKAADKAVMLASDVDGFIVTSDRDLVYYASDDTLYSANGKNGRSKRTVCNDEVDDVALSADDVLFYLVDGDLYATSNGKAGDRVLSDVENVEQYVDMVLAGNDDELYISTGSKKLKKILTFQ